MPPISTNWSPPPVSTVALAVPPLSTKSAPSPLTIVPWAKPRSTWTPPELIVVPIAVPPEPTTKTPPSSTVTALSVCPLGTTTFWPDDTVNPTELKMKSAVVRLPSVVLRSVTLSPAPRFSTTSAPDCTAPGTNSLNAAVSVYADRSIRPPSPGEKSVTTSAPPPGAKTNRSAPPPPVSVSPPAPPSSTSAPLPPTRMTLCDAARACASRVLPASPPDTVIVFPASPVKSASLMTMPSAPPRPSRTSPNPTNSGLSAVDPGWVKSISSLPAPPLTTPLNTAPAPTTSRSSPAPNRTAVPPAPVTTPELTIVFAADTVRPMPMPPVPTPAIVPKLVTVDASVEAGFASAPKYRPSISPRLVPLVPLTTEAPAR